MKIETARHVVAVACVLALGPTGASWGAEQPAIERIRVCEIRPAVFEYVFTSVASVSEGKPILAFNHLGGRTSFVQESQMLGDYRVVRYESQPERVYVPSLNAYVEKKAGRVVLEDPSGKRKVLDLGAPLAEKGWMARLIALDTGESWYAGEQESLDPAREDAVILSITPTRVRASGQGNEFVVAFLSDEEKASLAARREAKQKEQNVRLELARQARQEASENAARAQMLKALARPATGAAARPDPKVTVVSSAPRLFFGTDTPYPTAFQTFPVAVGRTSYGAPAYQFVTVPTRFTRYAVGDGMRMASDAAPVSLRRHGTAGTAREHRAPSSRSSRHIEVAFNW